MRKDECRKGNEKKEEEEEGSMTREFEANDASPKGFPTATPAIALRKKCSPFVLRASWPKPYEGVKWIDQKGKLPAIGRTPLRDGIGVPRTPSYQNPLYGKTPEKRESSDRAKGVRG